MHIGEGNKGKKNMRQCPEHAQLIKDRAVLQAWELHKKGELLRLVDTSLNEESNLEEACSFLKIGLLCTQDMPKLRPSMSTVVRMLLGEIHVNDQEISKPGILSLLDSEDIKGQDYKAEMKNTSCATSSRLGKLDNSSSSSEDMTASVATMTFTSIYDRSK